MNDSITNPSVYPWQQHAWHVLCETWQNGKLPHGVFLYGQTGSGVEEFADYLTRYLLLADRPGYTMTEPERKREMGLLRVDNHQDIKRLPEPGDARLSVVAIRQAIDWVRLSGARQGQPRVLVLRQVETLNNHAANALLKTLEEPPSNVIILLLGNHAQALLPTLVSRCMRVYTGADYTELTWKWLEPQLSDEQKQAAQALLALHLGPLTILEMVGEGADDRRLIYQVLAKRRSGQGGAVPEEAGRLQEIGVENVFLWWRAIWLAIIHSRLTGQPKDKGLGRLADKTDLPAMLDFYAELLFYEQTLAQPGANAYNLLESALLAWDQLVKTGQG